MTTQQVKEELHRLILVWRDKAQQAVSLSERGEVLKFRKERERVLLRLSTSSSPWKRQKVSCPLKMTPLGEL